MARARTEAKDETAAAAPVAEAEGVAPPGTSEHLGERPYADEPVEWEDDRDDVPGTSDHLGERPYASEPDKLAADERDETEQPGTSEHLGSETPYAGGAPDE